MDAARDAAEDMVLKRRENEGKTKALPVEAGIQLKWFAIEYRKL
jgi:hypothetical protein